ncbi:MAG: hypothetical protein WD512_14165 [Candidatus Paceibacterota bacterium]
MNNLLNFLAIRKNSFKVNNKSGFSRSPSFNANTLIIRDLNRDRQYVEMFKYQQYFNRISWW